MRVRWVSVERTWICALPPSVLKCTVRNWPLLTMACGSSVPENWPSEGEDALLPSKTST